MCPSSAREWAASIRKGVARKTTSETVRKAFGVGQRVTRTSVASVAGAVATVLKAFDDHKDVLPGLGILAKDVEAGKTYYTNLKAADTVQEGSKTEATTSTTSRNDAQRQVEQAIDALVGAAEVEFASETEVRDQFRSLVPGGRHKKKASA